MVDDSSSVSTAATPTGLSVSEVELCLSVDVSPVLSASSVEDEPCDATFTLSLEGEACLVRFNDHPECDLPCRSLSSALKRAFNDGLAGEA